MHLVDDFRLPYAGGCQLGARTVEPHLQVLRSFGLAVEATDDATGRRPRPHRVSAR